LHLAPKGSIIGDCTENGLNSGREIQVGQYCALEDNYYTKSAALTGIPATSMVGRCQVLKPENTNETVRYIEKLLDQYKSNGYTITPKEWLLMNSMLPLFSDHTLTFKKSLETPTFSLSSNNYNLSNY
jgi:hypothetical protein